MEKESIDLLNVDYDDVLHLYKGWRKSEGTLREKEKELVSLKARIKQLQESHNKFRNQIQSLESVKELTIRLQNQLSMMQQENIQLVDENKELAELNLQAEQLLQEKIHQEQMQAKSFRELQLELANTKGRYEECSKIQSELEKLANDEQAHRMSTQSRLKNSEQIVIKLKEENSLLRQKLDSTTLRMSQCDQELAHASEQLTNLSQEVSNIATTRTQLSFLESENGILKGDISRLLRLIEYAPSMKSFFSHWQDSASNTFVGIDIINNTTTNNKKNIYDDNDDDDDNNNVSGENHRVGNVLRNNFVESMQHNNNTIQNNYEQQQQREENTIITPLEFAHLKRVHGGDPFPMTSNFQVFF
jgi:hypothetical protein